jgi:hypothetical protein
MKKNTCWILAVVSDTGQKETLPYQIAWAEETAAENGWTITRRFTKPGSTGHDGTRKLVSQMIEALTDTPKSERPERILMHRQDRIGRGDSFDTVAALRDIYRLGSMLHTRESGDVPIARAMDRAVPMLRSLVASFENEVRIDKANATYRRRRKAKEADPRIAVSNFLPYGLAFDNGYMVPQEPEADFVRQVFRMRADGLGCYTIAKQLRDQAPPMRLKDAPPRDYRVNSDAISRMLKKREYVDAGLIDATTWAAVVKRNDRNTPRKPRKYEWPLTGALKCECGYSLSGMTSKPRQTRYFWYVCRDRLGVHGGLKAFDKADIEEQFTTFLSTLRRVRSVAALVRGRTVEDDGERRKYIMKNLAALHGELGQIPQQIERTWAAFDKGEIAGAMVQARVEQLEARRKEAQNVVDGLERELQAMNDRQADADRAESIIKTVDEEWAQSPPAEQKVLAKKVADLLGGGLVVTLDGTLERDLLQRIAAAKIVVRSKLKQRG